MDWLIRNPIADMYGPVFLLFYGAVIVATLAACWWLRQRLDWTEPAPPPAVPSAPDPYEIAYLRGGDEEVARAVVFSLVQRGVLQVATEGREPVIERVTGYNGQGQGALAAIERRVLDWFTRPHSVSKVFRADALGAELRPFCSAYEQRLQRERMLTTPDMERRVNGIFWMGALLILLLGSYKLLIALSKGRSNVLFLILSGAIGFVILMKICRLPRLTRRGRTHLERLKLAFDGLSNRRRVVVPEGADASVAAFDPSLLLMVSLFGVGALSGTAYDFYPQTLRRQQVDGSGGAYGGGGDSTSSSSDGSSSDGGGSSCSGGSSCGGGCGGGGCGGCGG